MTEPTPNTAPDTAGLVERFTPAIDNWESPEMQPCANGDWVAYSALEAATARAEKSEAERDDWHRCYKATAAMVLAERDTALSRVTEAKAEIEALTIQYIGWPQRQYISRDAVIAALAQSGGADPAQGGRDDG